MGQKSWIIHCKSVWNLLEHPDFSFTVVPIWHSFTILLFFELEPWLSVEPDGITKVKIALSKYERKKRDHWLLQTKLQNVQKEMLFTASKLFHTNSWENCVCPPTHPSVPHTPTPFSGLKASFQRNELFKVAVNSFLCYHSAAFLGRQERYRVTFPLFSGTLTCKLIGLMAPSGPGILFDC